LIYLSHFQI